MELTEAGKRGAKKVVVGVILFLIFPYIPIDIVALACAGAAILVLYSTTKEKEAWVDGL